MAVADTHPLWPVLRDLTLDAPGASHPFSARLQREQGWSTAHTQAVIAEYRRFLFLAATAGHTVTPSVDVDAAWHLHLTYTRSYWDDLCRDVLGRPLHHEPTRGGKAETDKYVDLYARTKASYAAAFGHEAPASVWPARHDVGTSAAPTAPVRVPTPRRTWPSVGLGLVAGATGAAAGAEVRFLPAMGAADSALCLFCVVAAFVAVYAYTIWPRKAHAGDAARNSGASGCTVSTGCTSGLVDVFAGGDAGDAAGDDGGGGDGGDGGGGDGGGGDSGCGGGDGGGCGGGGCGGD